MSDLRIASMAAALSMVESDHMRNRPRAMNFEPPRHTRKKIKDRSAIKAARKQRHRKRP